MRQLKNVKEEIISREWICSSGCGCVDWIIKTANHPRGISVEERCELHEKDPKAFGGLLVFKERRND